ncbi:unnamed protein product [Urochloa decumbens]|uniref:Uncharacterized protein n=1 Tax=Urochloa decumbens TaxID=240449 RepID=A0ABC8XIF1_9POAL
MSKPWALQDLMTAVDAGHVAVLDSDKVMAPRRSSYGARGGRKQPQGAPPVETSSDASFEFSAVVSYSSASPASMVFSDGQLRAHQFPAVRSSAGSSEAASPVRRTASAGGGGGAAAKATMGSKKRVSFAADKQATAAAAGGQGKKSGGLLGCMGSACGSSRNEVVEPARNAAANRKVVAV